MWGRGQGLHVALDLEEGVLFEKRPFEGNVIATDAFIVYEQYTAGLLEEEQG